MQNANNQSIINIDLNQKVNLTNRKIQALASFYPFCHIGFITPFHGNMFSLSILRNLPYIIYPATQQFHSFISMVICKFI